MALQAAHKERKGKMRNSKRKPKAWWDREVATALATRRQACHAHRCALGSTKDEAETLALWGRYQEANQAMATMV